MSYQAKMFVQVFNNFKNTWCRDTGKQTRRCDWEALQNGKWNLIKNLNKQVAICSYEGHWIENKEEHKKEKTEQFISDLSYTEELNLFQRINDFVVFYIRCKKKYMCLIAIENFVIGSYFAIYNDEIVMKLYLVLKEMHYL